MAKKKSMAQAVVRRKSKGVAFDWSSLFGPSLSPEPDPAWVQLAKAYPDQPALKSDTVYSIPPSLIDAIKREAPKFFNRGEENFERDLSAAARVGFFLKRKIFCELLGGRRQDSPTELTGLDKRQAESDARIKEMLAEEMRRSGASEKEVESYWKVERQMSQRLDGRRTGYAGWLATDGGFRQSCDLFRQGWHRRIEALGGFPSFPMSFFGESPGYPPKEDRRFYEDFMMFYWTWSLHAMATWELPIPMRPGMAGPSFYELQRVHGAGITLFLPWYLLRDKDLKIREVIQHKVILLRQPQLAGWLAGKKNLGHERYAAMLHLYVYLELALKARYGDRIRGQTSALDYAFGHFLSENPTEADTDLSSAESIRKIRQEMGRRVSASSTGSP